MVSVYLSNQNIEILEGNASGGHVTLKARHFLRDTQNCIINGIVTDAEAFVHMLSAFWEEQNLPRKNVCLVLGSSQLATRLLTMPALRRKDSLRFLIEEFGDVERAADPLFSSTLLEQDRKTKLCKVLAAQADRAYIRSYVDLFASFDVEITSILPSLDCVVRLLREVEQCGKKTSLVQVMDDSYMTVLVFVDGAYVYSSRKRMFNEPDTPEYCAEATQAVSNLEQFLRANYKEHPLQNIILYGFGEADFERCRKEITANDPERRVMLLPADELIRGLPAGAEADGGILFPAGSFLRADRKLTFMNRQEDAKQASSGLLLRLLPVWILLAAMLAMLAALEAVQMRSQARLSELTAQMDALEAQVSDAAFNDIDNRLNKAYTLTDGMQTALDDMEKAHQFIALLKQEDLFTAVDYTGYTYQDRLNNWRVNVVCSLKESAGRTGTGK